MSWLPHVSMNVHVSPRATLFWSAPFSEPCSGGTQFSFEFRSSVTRARVYRARLWSPLIVGIDRRRLCRQTRRAQSLRIGWLRARRYGCQYRRNATTLLSRTSRDKSRELRHEKECFSLQTDRTL